MDSDDDFDWVEVPVPEHEQHIEITLQPDRKAESLSKKRTNGISYAERLLRIDCHKIHTVTLLANARIRNKWLNDSLLHARLLSLTPIHLQNAFAMIHKSRVPDQNQRGRMFEAAVGNLTEWWTSFFDVLPEGHIRNRTYDDVRLRLIARGLIPSPSTSVDKPAPDASSMKPPDEITILVKFLTSNVTPLDVETIQGLLDDEGETIRSPKSLMKHALMRCASRDTSSQLFTALCRALDIPARLVVSLQSLPWQSSVGKPKPKHQRRVNGKRREEVEGINSENEDVVDEIEVPATGSTSTSPFKGKEKEKAGSEPELFLSNGERLDGGPVRPKSEKAKGKEKAEPPVKLRKQKKKGYRPGSLNNPNRVEESPDPLLTPPVFWTEVFSRPDGRWLPVDPIRGFINKRKLFDPTPSATTSALPRGSTLARSNVRQENRMMYVLAFEEDGYARDVTRRYAREYSTKVAKAQAGGSGKVRQLWWARVVQGISRPYRLHRDDVEDEELEVAQLMEGMPTTLAGFKDHPLYVITRHLKQNEVIHPPPPETHEVGKYRGEPVYPRSAVISLRTAETWMRTEGRTVKSGCQPLKMVKLRVSTVGKMREVEVLRDAGSGERDGFNAMQGLYAMFQTEPFVPDPVIDGIVPKNNFGNIDLYVPSMLPKGAAHVPFRGIAKIAKKLGFDHAEAVTGFEFKKRKAYPIVEGIVIAEENESALLEAYWEWEKASEEKARAKHKDQALKRWIRLIQGLRIRQRLLDQYANKSAESQGQPEERSADEERKVAVEEKAEPETSDGCGFLIGADDVVQAFSLPKYQHISPSLNPTPNQQQERQATYDDYADDPGHTVPEYVTYDIQAMDVNPAEVGDSSAAPTPTTAPMTMQELAEAAARKQSAEQGVSSLGTIEAQAANTIVTEQTAKALHLQKTSRQSTLPADARPRKRAAPAAKDRGYAKPRTTVGRSSSSRKRKRSGEDNHIDSDDFESDHNDEGDLLQPKKKSQMLARTPVPSSSTRVLRPLKSRTQAN